VQEGETGNTMYFISKGQCEILKGVAEGDEEMCLKVISKGDFFGEGYA